MSKKIIRYLVILNLAILAVFQLKNIEIVKVFINVIFTVIFIPIIFGTFLFYILKPLNNIFIKKNVKKSISATLTLFIFIFIMAGIVRYFGNYLLEQFYVLRKLMYDVVDQKLIQDKLQKLTDVKNFNFDYYGNIVNKFEGRAVIIVNCIKNIFSKGMKIISDILLVFLITFYLLRDGHKVKDVLFRYTPIKFKAKLEEALVESDEVLSHYILGQATVALSLSIMVYIGYRIIGLSSPLFLASTTFLLAFIPFVGFFVSMIIPYIMALTTGGFMILKLSCVFIIAQVLKGRLVVPFIMGKTMNIHPLTDIFLVVGAATLIGPMGAFVIVPIYSVIKIFVKIYSKEIKKYINKV